MNPRLVCVPTAFALLVAGCGSKPPTVAAPSANEIRATEERDAAIAQAKRAAAEQELAEAALRAQTAQIDKLGAQVALLQDQLAAQQQAARIKPPSRPAPDRAKTYGVPVGDGYVVGSPSALVTLIRAYEYACPFCERSRETMEQLQTKYGSSLRIVYKPLVVHPLIATAPALAACAANQQGKFVQMDDLIWADIFKARNFDPEWTKPDDSKEPCWDHGHCDNLNALAQKLRLNLPQFKRDMKGVCQKQLQSEMASLQSFGVSATPGFFINGRFLSGAQPIETFSALIDEELAKAVAATQHGLKPAQYYQTEIVGKGLKSLDGSAAAVPPTAPPTTIAATGPVHAATAADLPGFIRDLRGNTPLTATIDTNMGTLHCVLFDQLAPMTVANFVGLARGKLAWLDTSGNVVKNKPFYDGLTFHRVIPGFMIQGGDPQGHGTGGPGFRFVQEIAPTIHHQPGTLSMANAGPDTNGSQFFIMDAGSDGARLDGGYNAFGACAELDVVSKIAAMQGPRDRPTSTVTINKITISR